MISSLIKFGLAFFALLPLITFAQEGFVPLVGVPFIDNVDVGRTASTRLAGYANAFYIAAISLGAVVAVLKIIWAGVKYMLSDVITDKTQAKADIKGALLGLILIIGAVLMLNTISPNITALQAFNLTALRIDRPEQPTTPGPPVTAAEVCAAAEAQDDTCLTESCGTCLGGSCSEAYTACRENCRGVLTTGQYGATTCTYSRQEAIDQLISENCPAGETCVAETCENLVFSCASECDDLGEFYYDEDTDVCIRAESSQSQQLQELAETRCPEGRTCRAEPCDTSGTFYNCTSQCLQERNGVYYDSNTNSCVFYNDSYDPVSIPITVDPEQQYYQLQTEDDLAAGDPPIALRIIDTDVTGGFVTVEYPDGRQVELSCGYVVPNLCGGTP